MSKRIKKVQKRAAKKKAAQKKLNLMISQEQLAMKEQKRYQSALTKHVIINALVSDLAESKDDCELYFSVMENELSIDFDKESIKPAAIEIEETVDGDITYRTADWYERFIEYLSDKYGEEEAREKAWYIQTGFMTCMSMAKEIVLDLEPSI